MNGDQLQDKPGSDIGWRLVSAAAMIPFGLFVVWHGGLWLTVSAGLIAGIMAFEWARLTREPAVYFMIPFAVIACLLSGQVSVTVTLLILISGALAGMLLMKGALRLRIAAGFGCLYAGGFPLAFLILREGAWDGRSAALIIMAIVWASDSGAYFAGRGFGGPLLSPKDSPNKTWSGAFGGVICSALSGIIAAKLMGANEILWLVSGVLLSVVAQVGDLFESQVKRRYQVKDTSGFLPGHGGVMDRLDGLGSAAVFVLLIFLLVPGIVSGLGFAL